MASLGATEAAGIFLFDNPLLRLRRLKGRMVFELSVFRGLQRAVNGLNGVTSASLCSALVFSPEPKLSLFRRYGRVQQTITKNMNRLVLEASSCTAREGKDIPLALKALTPSPKVLGLIPDPCSQCP